jgi:hypothetical protein
MESKKKIKAGDGYAVARQILCEGCILSAAFKKIAGGDVVGSEFTALSGHESG